jgi:hypothetical protein
MANVLDTDLLIDTLSTRAITTLGDVLAPLGAFCNDFTDDVIEPVTQTKSVQVPLVTTAGAVAVQTNPTNFETGDTNTSNVAITVNHYSKSFHVTSDQLNKKLRLETLVDKNAQAFAQKIMAVALADVNTSNFTTSVTIAQASIAAGNLQTAWATIAKSPRKSILLDATAYSKLIPATLTAVDIAQKGAYGFDGGFFLQTYWTGAVTNTYGFACGPGAIATYSGIPAKGPGVAEKMISERTIVLPGLNLPVQLNIWTNTSTRALWASFDCMFGAAYGGDANQGCIFLSA